MTQLFMCVYDVELDFNFYSAANQQVDAIHVTQLERDTVLVCLDRKYGDVLRKGFSKACSAVCPADFYLSDP